MCKGAGPKRGIYESKREIKKERRTEAGSRH